jgi:hypothetical protein
MPSLFTKDLQGLARQLLLKLLDTGIRLIVIGHLLGTLKHVQNQPVKDFISRREWSMIVSSGDFNA